MANTAVELSYACPRCGKPSTAVYDNGDRQYGDLPDCKRGCVVPFAVLDAMATWLDDCAMNGSGVPVAPSRADTCGYDSVDR